MKNFQWKFFPFRKPPTLRQIFASWCVVFGEILLPASFSLTVKLRRQIKKQADAVESMVNMMKISRFWIMKLNSNLKFAT